MRATSRFSGPVLALVAGVLLAACTEGTSPGSLGQLRVRPVFAPGEDPASLGVSVTHIHLVLRRAGGAVVADTTLPYVTGETTSWLIDLQNPPESVDMSAQIGQGGATMYTGADTVALPEGIGTSGTEHDLPVRFLGGPEATYTIDVSPDSASLDGPGATQQYAAVARDSAGAALTGFTFTWSSSRPDIATVNASTGLVTGLAAGRAVITAAFGGVSDTAVARVGLPGTGIPVAIIVTPPEGFLSPADTLRFKALVIDVNGDSVPGVPVTWTSTNPTIASVSTHGLATAISPGHTNIVASSGTLADSSLLTVLTGTGGGVASIVVTPATATLTSIGAVQQYIAVARDGQGNVLPNVTFTWSSANAAVATVDGTGQATAVANGTTSIVATAGGVSGSAGITVELSTPGPPAFIIVTPPTSTLTALGATQQYTAVVLDTRGRIMPGVPLTWSSAAPAVAAVNATGLVTAVSPGQSTITASTAGLTGTAQVTVVQVLHAVLVTPPTASIIATDSATFTATARDANGHVIPGTVFTWTTNDPSVATVGSNGVATGVGGGSTLVTATTGGKSGSATLSVVVAGSIRILGQQERLLTVGNSTQFTAEVRDIAGNIITGVTVTWSVAKPGVASIDPVTGVATALTSGLTLVRARVANLIDEVELVIRP